MNIIKRYAGRRTGFLVVTLAFTAAVLAPAFVSQIALAAQVSPRKITLSSSASGNVSTDANGATVARGSGGNGAFAAHTYNFTTGTAGAVQSILLQYCTTPLLDTACTAPTGMDASTVASVVAQSGFGATAVTLDTTTSVTTGGIFSTSPCASRAHCITLQRTGGASIAASTALSVAFGTGAGTDWIKNPTAVGTFYVRIYTFSNNTYTTQIDSGAVAAAIATQIDITAKVQEKLNFSVAAAKSDPSTGCTALSGTGAVALGDGTGVLDIATAYDARSYFRVSTNAANGTNILYSGDTLKNAAGTISITASPNNATTGSIPGTEQFGLAIDTSDTAGFGYSFTNLAATSPYTTGAGTINPAGGTARFAFNTASVTTPVQIAGVASGSISCDTGAVRYIGNIGTTTRAGVYKTTITYIAVPTF